jgi:hypothetical protein
MVDPNVRGQLGRTALFEACEWGNDKAVRYVLHYKQVAAAHNDDAAQDLEL